MSQSAGQSETREGSSLELAEIISALDRAAENPSIGLPDEIFYFVSRMTPLVNVDLLIKNEKGETLLSWRNDPYCGAGWHIPGGIIRHRETMDTRIRKVAEKEIGCLVDYDPVPIKVTEMIHTDRAERGHFISFLFACRLPTGFAPENKIHKPNEPGYLKWHPACPDDLIRFHKMFYRDYI